MKDRREYYKKWYRENKERIIERCRKQAAEWNRANKDYVKTCRQFDRTATKIARTLNIPIAEARLSLRSQSSKNQRVHRNPAVLNSKGVHPSDSSLKSF